jgi:hypothetical protein
MDHPYLCKDDQGREHLHIENWFKFLDGLEEKYPRRKEFPRAYLTIRWPEKSLWDVHTHWSPTGPGGHHKLNHVEADWSVIFEAYSHPNHGKYPNENKHLEGKEHLGMLIEKGHVSPLGERILLATTAKSLDDKHSNAFASFRGMWWRIGDFQRRNAPTSKPATLDFFAYESVLPPVTEKIGPAVINQKAISPLSGALADAKKIDDMMIKGLEKKVPPPPEAEHGDGSRFDEILDLTHPA